MNKYALFGLKVAAATVGIAIFNALPHLFQDLALGTAVACMVRINPLESKVPTSV